MLARRLVNMTSDGSPATNFPAEINFLVRQHAFYDESLLSGLTPWEIPESERGIIAHYYMGQRANEGQIHWFITYYDAASNVAYGFACLSDPQEAEWGEIPMEWLEQNIEVGGVFVGGETMSIPFVVKRDLDWEPVVFHELRQDPRFKWINESHNIRPL